MRLIIILSLLLLSGCETMSKIMDFAGDVNDEALISAEATICRAASIGSVLRRYDTEEKAKAWKELCTSDTDSVPIILETN